MEELKLQFVQLSHLHPKTHFPWPTCSEQLAKEKSAILLLLGFIPYPGQPPFFDIADIYCKSVSAYNFPFDNSCLGCGKTCLCFGRMSGCCFGSTNRLRKQSARGCFLACLWISIASEKRQRYSQVLCDDGSRQSNGQRLCAQSTRRLYGGVAIVSQLQRAHAWTVGALLLQWHTRHLA